MLDWIDQLNPAGWMHLIFMGVVVPLGALRSRRLIVGSADRPAPPLDRIHHFRNTLVSLSVFGLVSVLTATSQGIALLRFDAVASLKAAPVAALAYGAAVLYMRPRWRRAVEKKGRLAHLFMPQNHTERTYWVAVSILAGVTEEITWRGVQSVLLNALIGDALVATAACAVLFGAAHAVQGWRSAALIVVFALAFQGLVWLSGSLFLSIVTHIAYDITAGLTYGKLGTELGYRVDDCSH